MRQPKWFDQLVKRRADQLDPRSPAFRQANGPFVSASLPAGATVADVLRRCDLDPADFGELPTNPFARGHTVHGFAADVLRGFGLRYPERPTPPKADAFPAKRAKRSEIETAVSEYLGTAPHPNIDRCTQFVVAKFAGTSREPVRAAYREATGRGVQHRGKKFYPG
jgi:hypothetical protein